MATKFETKMAITRSV